MQRIKPWLFFTYTAGQSQGAIFIFITEARITYDRQTVISIGKGSTGIGLSAADHEMITAHNIIRPHSQTSQTKRRQKQCDSPGRVKREPGQELS